MKGGSGKSTGAMCLAAYWQKSGVKVACVDADPAATLSRWIETGTDLCSLRVVAATPLTINEHIDSLLVEGFERIIVDTPGFKSGATDSAISRAQLIIIPLRPSPIDYQVAMDTWDHIQHTTMNKAASPSRVCFLITQATRGSVIARHMREQIGAADNLLLDAELPTRVAYGEAALNGSTPSYYQPRGAAAADIARLATEIELILR